MESISFVPIKAWNHCFTHCSIENLVTSSCKNKCKLRFDYVKCKTLEESQQLNLLAVIQRQKDTREARYHDER